MYKDEELDASILELLYKRISMMLDAGWTLKFSLDVLKNNIFLVFTLEDLMRYPPFPNYLFPMEKGISPSEFPLKNIPQGILNSDSAY